MTRVPPLDELIEAVCCFRLPSTQFFPVYRDTCGVLSYSIHENASAGSILPFAATTEKNKKDVKVEEEQLQARKAELRWKEHISTLLDPINKYWPSFISESPSNCHDG
ncbi:hypothetical protein ACFE04_017548 [Oxalis oulophora]